ncbi:MAG: hypothetical protein Q9187_002065 [Circinaria calcarea]
MSQYVVLKAITSNFVTAQRRRFDEDFEISGERPYVTASATPPKFHLDDRNIYIKAAGGAGRGPYTIANVDTTSTPIKYSLTRADGASVDNGALYEETRLEQKN